MNHSGPSASATVTAAYSGARVALVGFEAEEARQVASLLSPLGGLSHRIDPRYTGPGDDIDFYSTVLLNLSAIAADSPWTSVPLLLALKAPIAAVGTCAELNRFQAIQAGASELIFRPLKADELMFRVRRCLSRTIVTRETSADRKPRIVIADDDRSILALAAGILRARGFECHEAEDGRKALELSRALLPDLLILDVGMPFVNGFDILRSLRQDPSTAAMRILLFTAASGADDVRRGTDFGASSYLCKPFRPFDFLQRVKLLLPALSPAPESLIETGAPRE